MVALTLERLDRERRVGYDDGYAAGRWVGILIGIGLAELVIVMTIALAALWP